MLGVPWYTDLERLIRETSPSIGVVSVAYGANGQVGRMAIEAGLHVLVETPIAHDLTEADALLGMACLYFALRCKQKTALRVVLQDRLTLQVMIGEHGHIVAPFLAC
jgi:Oxidoreductase family, NAD-binding Rossmann fold